MLQYMLMHNQLRALLSVAIQRAQCNGVHAKHLNCARQLQAAVVGHSWCPEGMLPAIHKPPWSWHGECRLHLCCAPQYIGSGRMSSYGGKVKEGGGVDSYCVGI
jgi:hypothetical protein